MRIAAIVHERPHDDEVGAVLLKRLEFGVPAELLAFATLGVELTRGELLTLWRAGITTVDNLAAIPLPELERLVGGKGAALQRSLASDELAPAV